VSAETAGEKKMATGENFGDSFHPEKEGARGVGGRRSEHGGFHWRERERTASTGPREKKRAWWRRMKFWGFSKLGFGETVVGPNGLVF